MPTIFYQTIGLSADNEQFVENSLKKFAKYLSQEPTRWNILVERLDDSAAQQVDDIVRCQ